jgi:hypothetical protein
VRPRAVAHEIVFDRLVACVKWLADNADRDLVEELFGAAVRLGQERISLPRIAAAVGALS